MTLSNAISCANGMPHDGYLGLEMDGKFLRRCAWVSCFCWLLLDVRATDFNILDFGATGDGVTMNTGQIQAAIDAAHQAGGGRVVMPEGTFLSGTLVMKSHVELHVMRGAVLLGSTNPEDYLKLNRWKALIMADGQEQISLTGQGVIDGQGRALALHIDSLFYEGLIDSADYNFIEVRPKYYLRPQLIEFVDCRQILVKHLTLKNAACWVQVHDKCRDVVIDSVRTESDAYWNNDGIDISDCVNVRITNCFVNSADDGICLKSHSASLRCENIYIANCTIRSSASALKFGTRSHGGFRHVVIEHIKVYDTFRSAIAIECVDGGILEDVTVDDVQASNTGNALFIRLGRRNQAGEAGVLRNVRIRNLRAEVAFQRPDYGYDLRGPELPFFHNVFPASITGIPEARVENVTLEHLDIRYPGRGNKGLAYAPLSRLDDVPERISEYPEFSMFGELPAWGLYVRHVDGLVMKDIRMSIDAPDYRPAVVCDDVDGLEIRGAEMHGDRKPIHILLRHARDILVDNPGMIQSLD